MRYWTIQIRTRTARRVFGIIMGVLAAMLAVIVWMLSRTFDLLWWYPW